jgi:hypothetical protein
MLTKPEGAQHCGRSVKRFEIECPVHPICFPNGDLRYDVQELDKWLDSLKCDGAEADEIVAKLP